jgi:hypothetical protein
MDDEDEDSTNNGVHPGEEEDFTLHDAEEGHGPNHGRHAWDMDEDEPICVVELAQTESATSREFPNANGDMDAANNTSAV